jgi:hypothetical protein
MKRRLDWNEIRRRHPDRMARHLESLNMVHREGAKARETRLRALLGVMPAEDMKSWELRDELAQAWEDVYGVILTGKEAWLEVRFGIRRGVFILRPDGKYGIMHLHGQKEHD